MTSKDPLVRCPFCPDKLRTSAYTDHFNALHRTDPVNIVRRDMVPPLPYHAPKRVKQQVNEDGFDWED